MDLADDGAVDLTPRTPVAAVRPRRRRKWKNLSVLSVVLIATAVLVFKFLTNSTQYFCNVDEVGVKSGCMDTSSRFRLQGVVAPGTVKQTADEVDFALTYGGKTVQVHHQGDPSALFQPGIAVVVEGTMVGSDHFQSDLIMVKHSEKYEKEHPDRVPSSTSVG